MEDVVVLVPGFLGFARFGGFYYFADRLVAMLRGSLEQPEGRPLPVVPVTTLPTDNLRNRQKALLEQLDELSRRVYGVEWIHLIGHSTGGVDAQLLACTRSIDDQPWPEKWERVRRKIKTVITISAPHFGTELADSPFASLGTSPLDNPRAVIAQARTIRDLLRLVPRYLAANVGVDEVRPNDVLKFIWQVIQNHELINDLRPENMEALRARLVSDDAIKLRCFVTGTTPRSDKDRPSDPLYADLYRLTEGPETVSQAVLKRTRFLQEQVEKDPKVVISSPMSKMPDISPELNDGVVNTVRQIVNLNSEELGGFVVGDHADVLGHYDHQDALIGGKPYDAGLFHSGAGFGDHQFFALYWRVAQLILASRTRARRLQKLALQKKPLGVRRKREGAGREKIVSAQPAGAVSIAVARRRSRRHAPSFSSSRTAS